MYMYMYMYMYMFVYVYVHVYICLYMFLYMCMYVYTYIRIYIYIYIWFYIFLYMCMYVYTYIRVCVCVYIYIYIWRALRRGLLFVGRCLLFNIIFAQVPPILSPPRCLQFIFHSAIFFFCRCLQIIQRSKSKESVRTTLHAVASNLSSSPALSRCLRKKQKKKKK